MEKLPTMTDASIAVYNDGAIVIDTDTLLSSGLNLGLPLFLISGIHSSSVKVYVNTPYFRNIPNPHMCGVVIIINYIIIIIY
jgi:hypothetical protein